MDTSLNAMPTIKMNIFITPKSFLLALQFPLTFATHFPGYI